MSGSEWMNGREEFRYEVAAAGRVGDTDGAKKRSAARRVVTRTRQACSSKNEWAVRFAQVNISTDLSRNSGLASLY